MKTRFEGDRLLVIMEKGESVASDISKLLAMPEMKAMGTVLTALGMVKNAVVAYGRYTPGSVNYERMTLPEPMEVLGISGFILKSEKWPFHFHATLSDAGMKAWGGHLFDAEVVTFIEISLLLSDSRVTRIVKEGLPEMDFGGV
ncbi:MAG: DNA-binding protein [Spirochaetes bacterium]|nr:DNA-binding protein [Spirochaetota bacterium]